MSRTPSEAGRVIQHPPAWVIDQLAFGPEDSTFDDAVLSHVEACAECTERIRSLRQERAAYQATHPSAAFLARLEERMAARDPRRFYRRSVSIAAVAATLGVAGMSAVLLPRLDGASDRPAIKMKGETGLALRVHVSRDGRPAAPFDLRDPVRPGDVLRFIVDLPQAGHVTIMSIDERARVSWYYPTESSQARPLGPGRSIVLSGAIELDDYIGKELLVLVSTNTPPQKERLNAQIQTVIDQANGDLSALRRTGFGARTASLLITKAARQ